MQVKELLRKSRFENYIIKVEGEDGGHFVDKDKAFKYFGVMYVTEIDYSIIFANSENGVSRDILTLRLLVKDRDKLYGQNRSLI